MNSNYVHAVSPTNENHRTVWQTGQIKHSCKSYVYDNLEILNTLRINKYFNSLITL